MDKSTRRSKNNINMSSGPSYSATNTGGFSAGAAKPGNRVKAASGKRLSGGSYGITKMSSD